MIRKIAARLALCLYSAVWAQKLEFKKRRPKIGLVFPAIAISNQRGLMIMLIIATQVICGVSIVSASTVPLRISTQLDGSGGENGHYGRSVAIDGDYMAVGHYDDFTHLGRSSGSVDIFTLMGNQWELTDTILADDGGRNDLFGVSVDLKGDLLVVGSTGADPDDIANAGAAYVFERDNVTGQWQQIEKISAPDAMANDQFGYDVAFDGLTLVVGADFDHTEFGSDAGSAYVFERGMDGFVFTTHLKPAFGASYDHFGSSVSVSGGTIVVGAVLANTVNGSDAGAAYLFERDDVSGAWAYYKELTVSGLGISDLFGAGVSVSGDTVVVGGLGYYEDFYGGAHVFQRDLGGTGAWGELKRILPFPDSGPYTGFGFSLDFDGDMLVVGAPVPSNDAGQAHLYGRNVGGADQWGKVRILSYTQPIPGSGINHYGIDVALYGDWIAVGALKEDHPYAAEAGALYVYYKDSGGAGNWGNTASLQAGDGGWYDQFGATVALLGSELLVGAPGDNSLQGYDAGSVFFYGQHNGIWSLQQTLRPASLIGGDNFGKQLALGDDALAVAASGNVVFLYDRIGPDWVEGPVLDPGISKFGRSIAFQDDLAVVGAGDETVYIFGRDVGGVGQWGELSQLSSLDGQDSEFGTSVDISGDHIVVGGPNRDPVDLNNGSIYVFRAQPDGQNWTEVARQDGDFYKGKLGSSVAIDGDCLIAGSPGHEFVGRAFIFCRDVGGSDGWGRAAELESFYFAVELGFGTTVAMDGDQVAVGVNVNSGHGWLGTVEMYNRVGQDPTIWEPAGVFGDYPEVNNTSPAYGSSISISGINMAVGSKSALIESVGPAGAVFMRDLRDEVLIKDGFEGNGNLRSSGGSQVAESIKDHPDRIPESWYENMESTSALQ